jgi:hypothetical protein
MQLRKVGYLPLFSLDFAVPLHAKPMAGGQAEQEETTNEEQQSLHKGTF